jgi:hypothetical protein
LRTVWPDWPKFSHLESNYPSVSKQGQIFNYFKKRDSCKNFLNKHWSIWARFWAKRSFFLNISGHTGWGDRVSCLFPETNPTLFEIIKWIQEITLWRMVFCWQNLPKISCFIILGFGLLERLGSIQTRSIKYSSTVWCIMYVMRHKTSWHIKYVILKTRFIIYCTHTFCQEPILRTWVKMAVLWECVTQLA